MGEQTAEQIEVRGLRLLGIHGVLPEERSRSQPFEVDIGAQVDFGAASGSDDLADTVDYGELLATAARVVTDRSFGLLETLAAAVAEELLRTHERILEVQVTVRKLRPPVPFEVGSVGVTVRRRRGVAAGV